MATALDILDTAIKVGLGALVSGAAGYLVAARSQRFETKKMRLSEKAVLLRSAALKLEESSSLLNQTVHALFHVKLKQRNAPEELVELLPEFTKAFNLVKEARALSLLAGQRQLGALLANYGKSQDSIHRHYAMQGIDFDSSMVTTKLEELTELKTEVLEAMGVALDLIHDA